MALFSPVEKRVGAALFSFGYGRGQFHICAAKATGKAARAACARQRIG
jgi:hypothetical protein